MGTKKPIPHAKVQELLDDMHDLHKQELTLETTSGYILALAANLIGLILGIIIGVLI